jgi:outer membrane protein TolC
MNPETGRSNHSPFNHSHRQEFMPSPAPFSIRRIGKQLGLALALASSGMAQIAEPASGLPEDLFPELKPILIKSLEQAPVTITGRINLALSEANRGVAASSLYPYVGGTVSYAASTQTVSLANSISSSSNGIFYGFNLSQPVFQWGALRAQVEMSAIAAQVAERQYAEAYRTLIHQIRSQYLSLVIRKISLDYLRDQVAQSERSLAIEEEKLISGMIAPGDINGTRLIAAELRLRLDQTTADLDNGRRIFSRLVGIDDLPESALPTEYGRPKHTRATADTLLAQFLGRPEDLTPQGQIYSLYVKQADLSYKIARTRLYPKFALTAGYSLSNSTAASANFISQVAVSGFSYGISASWTLFDGLGTRYAKQSALATKRTYERALQTYTESVLDSAQNIRRQLDLSFRAVELSELRRDLAQDAVRLAREDLSLGVSSEALVDASVARFQASDVAALYARTDYLTRWSEFVSLVGADPAMQNIPARYVRPKP